MVDTWQLAVNFSTTLALVLSQYFNMMIYRNKYNTQSIPSQVLNKYTDKYHHSYPVVMQKGLKALATLSVANQ